MKRTAKWILIATGSFIALFVLGVVILLAVCRNPSSEPIPEAYLHARQIWSSSSPNDNTQLQLQIDRLPAMIDVSSLTTAGTTIQYPDEKTPRDVFPAELYFGTTDLRFNEASGIIYVKVSGMNPACGPSGERIFEYDSRRREPIRDYWVKVSK